MNEPRPMSSRPPVQRICYISAEGNPHVYEVDRNCITELREVEENGEYCMIPWIEVWQGNKLIARFNQHKLEHILYKESRLTNYAPKRGSSQRDRCWNHRLQREQFMSPTLTTTNSLAANREQKAEIERLKEDNSKMHRRNCWLETGIACAKSDRLGMKEKLDAFNSGGFADADAMAGKYLEEKAIVDRVWAALGISTYEQAGGKAIDEIVAFLRASVGEKWKPIESAPKDQSVFLGRKGNIIYMTQSCKYYMKWPHQEGGPTFRDEWNMIEYDAVSPWSPTHWTEIDAFPVAPTLPGEEKA